MGAGRFAPSPTGDLHIGNLRTALLAWLFARRGGDRFLIRFEDLDTRVIVPEAYRGQLVDLASLGLHPDEIPVRQSDRRSLYDDALAALRAQDLLYECYCSRREIREAAAAPNEPLSPGVYPGTCRDLSERERARRRSDRPAALRVRSGAVVVSIDDVLHGAHAAEVDDVVVVRNDGTPAYNLVVVVDDADQGITQVVRGDDLLSSTPRQAYLASLLGVERPEYAHVPLILGADGDRLAKRHGDVTLADIDAPAVTVRSWLAASVGLAEFGEEPTLAELVERFDPAKLPTEPMVWPPKEPPSFGRD